MIEDRKQYLASQTAINKFCKLIEAHSSSPDSRNAFFDIRIKSLMRERDKLVLQCEEFLQSQDCKPAAQIASDFPFNEMFKRGWFETFSGTLAQAKSKANELLADLLAWNCSPTLNLNREHLRMGKKSNPYALAAWQAQVKKRAGQIPPSSDFSLKQNDWAGWINELRSFIPKDNGISLAKRHLNAYGISLIAEKSIKGIYLDGMACIHPDGFPLIGLTTRHDRLDNFWFVLFHEIGHIALHLSQPGFCKSAFFDSIEDQDLNSLEREADEFAAENLIPQTQWANCVARRFPNKPNVLASAEKLNTSPAIIAGWIRRERNNHFLFGDLIGKGKVSAALLQPICTGE